jgi:O-antigen/teichoic acid export membrane protein
MRVVAFLVMAGTIVMFFIPDTLYAAIFGSAFVGVSGFVHLLVPGALFYSIYLVTTYFFSAQGLFRNNLIAGIAGLATNMAGCLAGLAAGMLSTQWVAACWSAGGIACMAAILWQMRYKAP